MKPQRRGAVWDPEAKCWYIDSSTDAIPFREWLGDDEQRGFAIESGEAYVAVARTSCWKCHGEIDVICLYCEQGLIGTEPYTQFSVSNIFSDRCCARGAAQGMADVSSSFRQKARQTFADQPLWTLRRTADGLLLALRAWGRILHD